MTRIREEEEEEEAYKLSDQFLPCDAYANVLNTRNPVFNSRNTLTLNIS